MEEERQEEQEQRAMAVQAGARCRLGNYLGWLAQDLVSQRLWRGHRNLVKMDLELRAREDSLSQMSTARAHCARLHH